MITSFFISILSAFVTFIVALLPSGSLPSGVSSAVTAAVGYIQVFDFLFPVGTLFTVLAAAIVFHLAMFLWSMLLWIISLVRGM